MTLSTNDMQTTRGQNGFVTYLPVGFNLCDLFRRRIFKLSDLCLPAAAQYDIGTTARHVGCDGYRSRETGLGNDSCFIGVEFSVKNVMRNARFGQFIGHHFGFFNRNGPHQHRLAFGGTLFDVFNDRIDFVHLGHVDQVWHILTDHRTVGRHHNGVEFVN